MKIFKETPAFITLPFVHLHYWIALVMFAGTLFMEEAPVMKIPLTQGKFAIVDAADFELVNKFKWYTKTDKLRPDVFYATRRKGKTSTTMHRVIMGVTDPKIFVDHRDGDGLNNTRKNLRTCNPSENSKNRRRACINSSSKYIGVHFLNSEKVWIATVHIDKKRKSLGRFKTEHEAALERDKWAKKVYGEFARLNFNEPIDGKANG